MADQRIADMLLEAVIQAIPYPMAITEIDTGAEFSLRFTWHGERFLVSRGGGVETVDGQMLVSGNSATLLQQLIKPHIR